VDASPNGVSIKFKIKFMKKLIVLCIVFVIIVFVIIQKVLTPKIPQISQEQKIQALSMFWKEASENFVYFYKVPKLNWDSAYAAFIPKVLATKNFYEYSRVMKKFAALLQDSHTYIGFDADALIDYDNFGKYKISLKEFDNKIYVVNTGVKTKDEIPLRSEILSVNNIPTEKYLKDSIEPYIGESTDYIRREIAVLQLFSGQIGTTLTIRIKTQDGKIRGFKLRREKCKDKWLIEPSNKELINFKWLDDKIAYIALNSFTDGKIVSFFVNLIPELLKCKGLIIDIRKNRGGSSLYGAEIIKHLTDKSYFVDAHIFIRKSLSTYKAYVESYDKYSKEAGSNPDTSSLEYKYFKSSKFKKINESYLQCKGKAMEDMRNDTVVNNLKSDKLLMPLVVLVGHHTACASETFLVGLEHLKRATLIGQKTCGCVCEPYSINLPGGGYAHICRKGCTYPDGRELDGIGIKPDIEVKESLDDYINHNDVTLKEATKYLTKLIKQTPAGKRPMSLS
jgi:C-terminal processing protease CtpA/Prc